MGLFLKGRLITMVHVVLAFIVSSLVAAYYIVMFARKFKDPDGVTKAVKAIGMVLELFFCIAALAAIHALHLKTAKTGFGLFSLFGVTSVGVNMIYFGLLVSHRGFEGSCEAASYPCTRSRLLIAFSMALFISSLVNLFVLMVLWHYEIKNSTTAPKPAAPGATTTVPAPAPVAAPAAPVPATTARSLPKATSSRAPVLPAFSFARAFSFRRPPTVSVPSISVTDSDKRPLYHPRGNEAAKYYELSEVDDESEVEMDFDSRVGMNGRDKLGDDRYDIV